MSTLTDIAPRFIEVALRIVGHGRDDRHRRPAAAPCAAPDLEWDGSDR